jgi:hypothetical protein
MAKVEQVEHDTFWAYCRTVVQVVQAASARTVVVAIAKLWLQVAQEIRDRVVFLVGFVPNEQVAQVALVDLETAWQVAQVRKEADVEATLLEIAWQVAHSGEADVEATPLEIAWQVAQEADEVVAIHVAQEDREGV